jgi:FkbM family methyltransferase
MLLTRLVSNRARQFSLEKRTHSFWLPVYYPPTVWIGERMIKRITTQIRWVLRARFFGIPFFRRAWLRPSQQIIVDRREMRLAYDAREEQDIRMMFFENFIDDQYGLAEMEGPISTIADIGANVGCFTLAAKAYFPAATIHAYEPNPRIQPVLQQNATKVGACMFPEAVGGVDGYVKMIDDSFSGNARTERAETSFHAIPQVTLEKVIQRLGGEVDLLKIDCEGAEWQILSDDHSLRKIKRMRMEYHLWGGRSFDELAEVVARHKFEIIHHRPQGEFGVIWCDKRAS